MYQGYQPQNTSTISKSINLTNNLGKSYLSEPQVVSLQREVDLYTRKFAQEERRNKSIQETYQIVLKEYQQKKDSLIRLQKKKQNTSTKLTESKIKNLYNQIDQLIANHNAINSKNNTLKAEIDTIRRECCQYREICSTLNSEIDMVAGVTENKIDDIERKIYKTQIVRENIAKLRDKNIHEKSRYFNEFDQVKNRAIDEKSKHAKQVREQEKFAIFKKEQKPIKENKGHEDYLRKRLKKIIANNKEKVRVIEQYQKNLRIIDEAFRQIKEGSGITDIEEITNTFIKSEEQNYSLYTYVDQLERKIDEFTSKNAKLEDKCAEQERKNAANEKLRETTPDDEKQKNKLNGLINQQESVITNLKDMIKLIKPDLESILVDMGKTTFNQNPKKLFDYQIGFDCNENNLQNYLADLEDYIDFLVEYKNATMQEDNNTSNINNTLLLDQIPPKEFKQVKNVQPNFTLDVDEKPNIDNSQLVTDRKLREIARETCKKLKQKNI